MSSLKEKKTNYKNKDFCTDFCPVLQSEGVDTNCQHFIQLSANFGWSELTDFTENCTVYDVHRL